MLKKILCLLFLLGISYFSQVYAIKEEPILSTQGIEIDNSIEKSKPSTEQKNEQKQNKNRSNKYIKHKKALKKQEFKRVKKLQELEYLEKRLEVKKSKLQTLAPNPKKGEEE